MANMKTEFELETTFFNPTRVEKCGDTIGIVGQHPNDRVYVAITIADKNSLFIQDKDLELFAVNILKALKSKHLKT